MGLADDVAAVLDGRDGVFGVYARNLGTNETIAIDADRILPAESAVKTCILVYFRALVAAGTIDPATRVRLDDTGRYIGTGVLRYLADGLEPTLADLAWLMIIVSDNTATAMLMQSIGGPADVNAAIARPGLPDRAAQRVDHARDRARGRAVLDVVGT